MMKISVIIPNYNGKNILKKNLPFVVNAITKYSQKKQDIELLIIDDSSTDASVDFLNDFSRNKKHIRIITTARNKGFSPTVNEAVRHATGEVIVLLNSDVNPEKDFLSPLVNHFIEPNVFAVGCLDKSIEGEKTISRGNGVIFWRKGMILHRAGSIENKNTSWVSCGSGAFRKEIWERLGGLNELYAPFYWEDIDISYRAQKYGYTVYFENKSVVIHEHEEGAIKKTYTDSFIKTISYRNQFIFIWKNITDSDLLLSHILWLPYHMLKAVVRGDSAFIKGFFIALIKIPNIVQCSSKEKSNYVCKDKDILRLQE